MFDGILLNTTVKSLKEESGGIRATFDGAEVKEREKVFDKVLVSVGRKPNSEIPGLDKTQVKVGPKGFIQVNKQLQTDDPSIYAIGDVVGEPMLAHKASHEGRTAVEAIAGHKVAFEPHAIPAVVFTDPEIAWAGLTETQAKEAGREIAVAKFPWGASGRAITLDRPEGMTKLILDPKIGARAGRRNRGSGSRRVDRRRRAGHRNGGAGGRSGAHDPSASDACRKRSWKPPKFSSAPARTCTGRSGKPSAGILPAVPRAARPRWSSAKRKGKSDGPPSSSQSRSATLFSDRSCLRLCAQGSDLANPSAGQGQIHPASDRPSRPRNSQRHAVRFPAGGAGGKLHHCCPVSSAEPGAGAPPRASNSPPELKAVLDSAFVGSLRSISTNPEGNPQPGLPPDRERVGTLSVDDTEDDVILVRVTDPNVGKIWLFSADTLAKIPELYELVQAHQVETHVPQASGQDPFPRDVSLAVACASARDSGGGSSCLGADRARLFSR